MKLTNGEIFNARGPLEELMNQKMPIRTSYALTKMASKLNEQLTVIEKIRTKLVQQYGKDDPKHPGMWKVTPDCLGYSQFLCDFGQLMQEETVIDVDQVILPDTLEVKPGVLMSLEKFVKI